MEQIESDYKLIIDALKEADAKISTIHNTQLSGLLTLVRAPLRQHINSLSTRMGVHIPGEIERAMITPGTPLTRIMGRDINPVVRPEPKPNLTVKEFKEENQRSAEDAELQALRNRIEEAIPKFKTLDEDKILDQYDDLTIRGVGRKVGLPISENLPKRIDAKLIKQIKEAIGKQDIKTPPENENPNK